jgi:hypothetical protein
MRVGIVHYLRHARVLASWLDLPPRDWYLLHPDSPLAGRGLHDELILVPQRYTIGDVELHFISDQAARYFDFVDDLQRYNRVLMLPSVGEGQRAVVCSILSKAEEQGVELLQEERRHFTFASFVALGAT